MAMCASGSLGIISAPQGGCSSICAAVNVASGSLVDLSVCAGKTAPHAMSEFYSYAPTYKQINLCLLGTSGSDGSGYVCRCHCVYSNAAMIAGESYTLCLLPDLASVGQATGSYAMMCVVCNCSSKYYCCLLGCSTAGVAAFTVAYSDAICIMNAACSVNTACAGCSASRICLNSVANIAGGGNFCKGSTCTCSCSYTG